ncbi:MAG: glycosyltransferase family 2 protein [Sphingobacteriaceae bacterium]|nr:glycosyltransferase family 2 protein [Sphingobacteriaceae bacterium]
MIEAIQSVQHFVNGEKEIIVVDNDSQDGTEKEIRFKFPDVQFIQSGSNLGFSKANNLGFVQSTGSEILLLNPDAKLINSAITDALNFLKQNPKTILGPKILNPDGTHQESVLNSPGVISVITESLFLSYLIKPKPYLENISLLGACLLMSRNVYESLSGLDENLFWMEDVDLCHRARQAGIKVHYYKAWEIVHESGQSIKSNYKISIANQLLSKLKFIRKHNTRFAFYVSLLFIQLHILFRLILFLILSPFKQAYIHKFFAYCYSQNMLIKYIFNP